MASSVECRPWRPNRSVSVDDLRQHHLGPNALIKQRVSLRTEELDYDLPPELIATRPAEPRDAARMLVVSRSTDFIEHRHVRDLPEYLQRDDVLVLNDTSVVPARIQGHRVATKGRVEGLFVDEIKNDPTQWKVLLKAGGRLQPGDQIELSDASGQAGGIQIELHHREDEQWIVKVDSSLPTSIILERVGSTPLPPYILKARGESLSDDLLDRRWYQTVYAKDHQRASVAAPTAGLHFTPELLGRVERMGVRRIDVTLHVGQGTFKPVTAATLGEHRMHSEWFELTSDTVRALASATGRVLAVGTTTVRTLESAAVPILSAKGTQMYGGISGMTDLLIAPPYEFQLVQGMLTNFHLPRSTLLALVAAMIGLERLRTIYREAIERGYRFYSYGDAMLILP
jgi:S-adenosylmethionine:tRNA ribosyltransferase-isomerase